LRQTGLTLVAQHATTPPARDGSTPLIVALSAAGGARDEALLRSTEGEPVPLKMEFHGQQGSAIHLVQHAGHTHVDRESAAQNSFKARNDLEAGVFQRVPDGQQREQDYQQQEHRLERKVCLTG
jgi:hypothetical protein